MELINRYIQEALSETGMSELFGGTGIFTTVQDHIIMVLTALRLTID